MTTYYYVALTRAVPGRAEEFHDWYDGRHLDDCNRVPGVKSAKRFRLLYSPGTAANPGVRDPNYDSLAIYELEGDDPLAIAKEFSARAGTAAMPLTEALAGGDLSIYIAQNAGERPPRDGD